MLVTFLPHCNINCVLVVHLFVRNWFCSLSITTEKKENFRRIELNIEHWTWAIPNDLIISMGFPFKEKWKIFKSNIDSRKIIKMSAWKEKKIEKRNFMFYRVFMPSETYFSLQTAYAVVGGNIDCLWINSWIWIFIKPKQTRWIFLFFFWIWLLELIYILISNMVHFKFRYNPDSDFTKINSFNWMFLRGSRCAIWNAYKLWDCER